MRPKILAVDDAKAVRLLAAKTLTGYDCDVAEAANGYNALFAMERTLPDLLLLDINMPVMNGVELIELLRSKPALSAIPVILLASPADHAVLPKLKAAGVAGVVMKPFDSATLLAAILAVLPLQPLAPRRG